MPCRKKPGRQRVELQDRGVKAGRRMTLASGLAAVAQLRAWRARCRVTQAKVDPGCCHFRVVSVRRNRLEWGIAT
jgi:hypothetical protein